MTANEIRETVKNLREYKRMMQELQAEIDAAEDLIKAEMNETGNYEITGDDFKVTYNEVTSTRVDTTALKKALPDVVARFTKSTTYRRFCLA